MRAIAPTGIVLGLLVLGLVTVGRPAGSRADEPVPVCTMALDAYESVAVPEPVEVGGDGQDCAPPGELAQQPAGPACCGATCGPGHPCCTGTVCSQSGRCIPSTCLGCGDRGCTVDYSACTSTCGPIQCCLNTCTSNSDCCSGTVCRPTSAGARQCVPEGCSQCNQQGLTCSVGAGCEPVCGQPTCCRTRCSRDADCCAGTVCMPVTSGDRLCVPSMCRTCTGMHPHCQISDSCQAVCQGPPNCGQACTQNTDCGVGSVCQTFGPQQHLCVPAVFDSECGRCPGGRCTFVAESCSVQCAP